MLDLDFSTEQEMLRDTLRGLLSAQGSLDVVRQMEDDPVGYPEDLWREMGALDLIGLMVPEGFGGAGMSLLEGVVLYEELGRSLVPLPHFPSAVMAAGILEEAGSSEQRQQWLGAVARGENILTTAWLEPESGFSARGVQLQAKEEGADIRLNGRKRHVPFAAAADSLVVLARSGEHAEDIDLFLVDRDAPGVSLTQQYALASDTQYEVRFDDVRVPSSARIGEACSGWTTWQSVLLKGLVLLAAQAGGGARYALDITIQYGKDRHQFDKPLGAFQAISHYLADAETSVDGAEQLVHEGAWAQAAGRSLESLAPMAKLIACRTFRDVTAMAQQVFGGIGFTVEFDIQLYFRRAKQLQLSWCDSRCLEEMVAASVLD